ncbi:kinase-like domain-containing protein [Flagelloscypha sp. PMI_526]|nr:kinase-like domain-containing protein [Flagelloscypha sp. PMI_526]
MPLLSEDEDVNILTDAEILGRFNMGMRLSPIDHPFAGTRGPRFITHNTVGKISDDVFYKTHVSYPNEALVLEVLRNHSTIPVPQVRRVIPFSKKGHIFLIIMDYIKGRQLSTIWHHMTDEEKSGISKTLKDYVQQLRQIDIPQRAVPGPLDPDLVPRRCFSIASFEELNPSRGPFGSYSELEEWYNGRREIALRVPGTRIPRDDIVIPMFDSSYPLVLTHQDLNPRNIIVGADEHHTLWIVDWGWSGFYPEWCESIAMKIQARNEERLWERKCPSWDAIIKDVCGEYTEAERFLDLIGRALDFR